METITHEDQTLAIIFRNEDWRPGLNFITPNNMFVQAGAWFYPKGKKLASHIHKQYDRTANRTHEAVYIKQGSLKVSLFDENKNFLKDFVMLQGDLAIMANGGHGYEILEDNTQVIETKNGPFLDVDKDKEKF